MFYWNPYVYRKHRPIQSVKRFNSGSTVSKQDHVSIYINELNASGCFNNFINFIYRVIQYLDVRNAFGIGSEKTMILLNNNEMFVLYFNNGLYFIP